jgi:hypothetical protein
VKVERLKGAKMRQYTVKSLLATYQWANEHRDGIIPIDWCTKLTGEEWLRWFRGRVQEKVSATIPGYGKGRKWDDMWQIEAQRTARAVNTPRLAVRWIPTEFRPRLSHRLMQD